MFVVFESEDYEGGSIIEIFSRLKDALDYVDQMLLDETKRPMWKAVEGSAHYWRSGCDTLSVDEWIVNGLPPTTRLSEK